MPKREHTTLQSGDLIDFLKSIGCIIYLPLAENDFQEKITGNYLQFTGNGSLIWDSDQQMYLCTTPSSTGRYVGSLPFPYNYSDFSENKFTRMWTYKRKTTYGKFCNLSSLSNNPDALTTGATTSLTLNLSSWGNNVGKLLIIEGDPRVVYDNESFSAQGTVYTPNLPSNWANNANTIYVGVTPNSDYMNKQVYMQDCLFFNRALSDSEIQQLYSVL